MGLRPKTFAPPRTWVPHISLVFGEMCDSTALTRKVFIPDQQLRSTSVSPTSRQKRARYGAPMFVAGQGLCSSSLRQTLKPVPFNSQSFFRSLLRSYVPAHGSGDDP